MQGASGGRLGGGEAPPAVRSAFRYRLLSEVLSRHGIRRSSCKQNDVERACEEGCGYCCAVEEEGHSVIGVYAIRHKATGRAYIGNSKNVAKRWTQHVLTGLKRSDDQKERMRAGWVLRKEREIARRLGEAVA